jgi:ribosomal protein L37AE/L43A
METKKSKKSHTKYECITCDYTTSSKRDYNRHLSTRKHIMETEETEKAQLICDICGKTYKNRTGLWKHKKNCKAILKNELREPESEPVNEELPDISKMITPDMIMTLLTQNQELMMSNNEFKELIVEQQQEMTKLQGQLLEVAKEGKTLFD